MKRTLLLCLSVLFCLSMFVSCAEESSPVPKEDPPAPEQPPEPKTVWVCTSEVLIDSYGRELRGILREYDDRGLLLKEFHTNPHSVVLPHSEEYISVNDQSVYEYDENGKLLKKRDENVRVDDETVCYSNVTLYEYDANGRVAKESTGTSVDGNENYEMYFYTLYTYDTEGREVKKELWRDWEGNDELYQTTTHTFDAGSVRFYTEGVNQYMTEEKIYTPTLEKPDTVSIKQWGKDDVTLLMDETDTYVYDENGNLIESKEHVIYYPSTTTLADREAMVGLDHAVYTYDEDGKLTESTKRFLYGEGEERLDEHFKYNYDENGNLTGRLSYNDYGELAHWYTYTYEKIEIPA